MARMKERLLVRKTELRWWIHKRPERIWMFVAWKLPRSLTMWAAIRVIAHATTGVFGSQNVPELSAMDAIQRWEKSNGT